jgi:hypothetical protein
MNVYVNCFLAYYFSSVIRNWEAGLVELGLQTPKRAPQSVACFTCPAFLAHKPAHYCEHAMAML